MRPTQAFSPDLPSRSLMGSLDPRLDPQLLEARGGSERGCNGLGSPSKRNRASLRPPMGRSGAIIAPIFFRPEAAENTDCADDGSPYFQLAFGIAMDINIARYVIS